MAQTTGQINLLFSADVSSAIVKVDQLDSSITKFTGDTSRALTRLESTSLTLFNTLGNKGALTFNKLGQSSGSMTQGIERTSAAVTVLVSQFAALNRQLDQAIAKKQNLLSGSGGGGGLVPYAGNSISGGGGSDFLEGVTIPNKRQLLLAPAKKTLKEKLSDASKDIGSFTGDILNTFSGGLFGQIGEKVGGLGTKLASSLEIGKVAATGLASVIAVGIVGAIGLAIGAAMELSRQFNNAKKDQLALIGVSSEAQRIFGVDQKTADNFYERLQVKTEIAGQNTSVSSQDITDLNTRGASSFLQAFKSSGESLDSITDKMVDINTKFAILAQATPGVTEFQVKNAYTAATTGGLADAIKTQEFFRNSGFREIVEQTAKDQNINLGKATAAQQIQILQTALNTRVPQELMDRAQGSIDAQTSAFTDKLFAARTGVFGIQRDTDLTTEGTQSVFSELSNTFKIVLGKGGLFDQIGKTFGFIDIDLMAGLRSGIKALNTFLELLTGFFSLINTINSTISSVKLPGTDIQGGSVINTVLSNAFIPNGVLANNVAGGIKNVVGTGFNFIKGLFGFGNSFTGNYPESPSTGNKSIFEAIATEKKYAPLGSKLLIANDSEYIFKDKQQLQAYISKSSNDSVVNFSSGAIQINGNNQDPQAIANLVIQEINNLFNFEKERRF